MTLVNRFASVLRWLVRRDRAETALADELQTYIDMSAAEKMRDGISRDDAYRQARMELGGLEQAKERVRTGRHGYLVDEISRDVRYAVRMFASHPGLTAVLLLTLALGIGANTAIFSLIDALMLRSLPVRNPSELVLVHLRDRENLDKGGESVSVAIVNALADRGDIFAGVAGFTGSDLDVGPPGSIRRVPGGLVTGDFYATLGLAPAAGRLLTRDDDRPGAPLAAVISESYWATQYGRGLSVLDQSLLINGQSVRIVGVTPRGFTGANVGAMADITLSVSALPRIRPTMAELLNPGNFWLRVLARPASGVSAAEAASRLNAMWPGQELR